MSSSEGGSGDGGGGTLPDWIHDLRTLTTLTAGGVTVASDPERWVKTVIAEWFVGGFLDAVQYVLGWIAWTFAKVESIILGAIPHIIAPYLILRRNLVGGIEALYGLAKGIAMSTGLAGPIASALAVAFVSAVLAFVAYAIVYVALNWIPGGGIVEGVEENLET